MKFQAFLWFLLLGGVALAQEPSAQKPLDQVQVLTLVAGGVPSGRVVKLVGHLGIDFQPTEDYLQSLEKAGAEDVLLKPLRAGRLVKPAAPGLSNRATKSTETQILEHLTRGALLKREDSFSEAVPEFRAALEMDPDNAFLHFALAKALLDQQEGDAAIKEYREALRLKPAFGEAHLGLGKALHAKNDDAGAAAEYREATRFDPDNADAHEALGSALKATGDVQGALVEYQEAVRLEPGSAMTRLSLGRAFEAIGDQETAEDTFQTARELAASTPIRVHLSGKTEAARQIFAPKPKYPLEAKKSGIQGTVWMEALISTDGTIKNLKVLDGHPVLAKAATDAAKQWRYRPVNLEGFPVEVIAEIEVRFALVP